MKRLLWLLILLILIVLIAVVLHHIPSYVLLQIGSQTVAAPLWLAIDALIVLLVIMYYLAKIIRFVWLLPSRLRGHGQARKQQKYRDLVKGALTNWVTEHYDAAAKSFAKLAQQKWHPVQSLLMAAKAAQLDGKQDAALDFINRVKAESLDDKLALHLVKFDAVFSAKQYDKAAQVLSISQQQFPKNPSLLRRALALYTATHDFAQQLEIVAQLQPISGDSDALEQAEIEAYQGLLYLSDKDDLAKLWDSIPDKRKKASQLIYSYAEQLLTFEQADEAYALLKKALHKQANAALFSLFSRIDAKDPGEQLKAADKLLPLLPESAETYQAMARICQRNQLTGKAKHYSEKAASMD